MQKYSSGLISESFWFIEFKKIIKLLNDGKSWDEIRILCLEDNILGLPKEYRAKRVYGYLKNRIETLDDKLINLFINTDLATQKIIDLMAIAKQNELFFEFLFDVYREKAILKTPELTDSDINIFFKNKQLQSEEVEEWTDGTLKRLRSCYMNYMTDAGLITVINKKKALTPPILDIAFEKYLEDSGEIQMIKALTGVK